MQLNKLLWAEGIVLSQQHFQQWDHYLEQRENLKFLAHTSFAHGILECIIDESALLAGVFSILNITVILPDGQLICYSATQSKPLTCRLEHKSTSNTSDNSNITSVYLTLSDNGKVNGISGYNDSTDDTTYSAEYRKICDTFDPQRENEVLFGDLNLQLRTTDEFTGSNNQHYCLKIAEIFTTDNVTLQLNYSFIPVVVHIKASQSLLSLANHLREYILNILILLHERRRQLASSHKEFSKDDLVMLMLLQTLYPALTNLQHYLHNPLTAPMELYLTLSRLVAGLSAFKAVSCSEIIPRYNVNQLRETFANLVSLLHRSLSELIPENKQHLQLQRESNVLYSLRSIAEADLTNNHFYLAVSFVGADIQWVNQFLLQVKIASYAAIDSYITSALPGVKLIHCQRLPDKLPAKSGYEYFYLEPYGECWQQIKSEQTLACFIPETFSSANIEIITVTQ